MPNTNSDVLVNAQLLIGGIHEKTEKRIEVRNPARPSELVGTIARGTQDHVDRAVAAAAAAQPAWAALSMAERREFLSRALANLNRDIEKRTRLFVRENGKTFAEAKGELENVAVRQKITLEASKEMDSKRELVAPAGTTYVQYVPYGVVVVIVPWNGPVGLATMAVIPALLAGNTVIVKPPETCPLTLIHTMELLAAELPKGLINIISGTPEEIGDRLTSHPEVRKISFTGSIPSAAKIMRNAAGTIKGVTVELGGNDPAIILEDANLDSQTMQRMASAVFRMTGQVCMAIKRIYVAEPIADQFLAGFGEAVNKIVVGDGLKGAVTMGPLHSNTALERAKSLLDDCRKRDAKITHYGKIDDSDTFEQGYFMRPTVITNISDEAPIVVQEQFCPIIPIMTFRHVDEALQRANNTVFGLGGSIWSKNRDQATKLAWQLQAGTVFVNTHGTQSVNRQAPYGGIKQSGMGRRSGVEGIKEYVQLQTLTSFDK